MLQPISAEQSTTKNGDKIAYGAWRAIDRNIYTTSYTEIGSTNWFKVNLDGMNCVQKVMWYYSDINYYDTIWSCSGDGCTCAGLYCSWSSLEVGVGIEGVGEVSAATGDTSDSNCKRGDAVLFRFYSTSWGVPFTEIRITGLLIPGASSH